MDIKNIYEMEVLSVIPEEVFKLIPNELREQFKYVEFQQVNEYESNKGDSVYMQLYSRYKKAKKDKNVYIFNKHTNK
jgi:dimeric dUTPase (all-alpha-NTP-PPase superfamily)